MVLSLISIIYIYIYIDFRFSYYKLKSKVTTSTIIKFLQTIQEEKVIVEKFYKILILMKI